MKDTPSPAAICLSHIEQDAYRSRVIAFHRQCIYSVISLMFLFTPKEMFMRPIKLPFISSPTAWIDSEVVCLWLDYTWRSSYAISFALLCLTGGIILTFHFITALYSLVCHLWLKWRKQQTEWKTEWNECIESLQRVWRSSSADGVWASAFPSGF